MRIVGVVGRKGGVGKTSIAVHMAADLATRKRRKVLLVDADMQGSATYWAEPGNLPVTVTHLPLEADNQVAAWSRKVRDLDADVVVLDGPPHLNAALGGIIGLADLVVIPCGPSGLDLVATGEAVGLVREIRGARGGKRPGVVLVPNRVDRRTTSGRELPEALADLGEAVGPAVGDRTAISDAFNAGTWIGEYAPNSIARREIGALADFVWKRLKLG